MLLMLAAIGLLLCLSAFFSGSETALTAASRPRIHQLENEGDRRAKLLGAFLGGIFLRFSQKNLLRIFLSDFVLTRKNSFIFVSTI